MEPGSRALQTDPLLSEPPGKPLSLLLLGFMPQLHLLTQGESNPVYP